MADRAVYQYKDIPVDQIIASMGDPLIKDLDIQWTKTKFPDIFASPLFNELRLSQLSDYTGIFGTDDPFMAEIDVVRRYDSNNRQMFAVNFDDVIAGNATLVTQKVSGIGNQELAVFAKPDTFFLTNFLILLI